MLLIPTPSGDESSTFVPWGGNDVKAGGDPLDAPEVQTSAERYASVHVEVIDSAEEVCDKRPSDRDFEIRIHPVKIVLGQTLRVMI